jgi:pSer/pThr/pTyr-binding forkhead associated (FHA) protein
MTDPSSSRTILPLLPVLIFLSSPSDLSEIRDEVKLVISELDGDIRYERRYKFILYAYEDRVPSEVGRAPQSAVDHYMLPPDKADIFICLFWKRLGSPTKERIDNATGQSYPSGTVYELLTAYHSFEKKRVPTILLYRLTAPAENATTQTPEQEQALETFLARFGSHGDLDGFISGQYPTKDELIARLRADLVRVIEHDLHDRLEQALGQARQRPKAVFLLPPQPPPLSQESQKLLETLRRLILGTGTRTSIVEVNSHENARTTLLASVLCYDPAVHGACPDGVLWVSLGAAPDLLGEQRRWIHALGGEWSQAHSVSEGAMILRRLLRDRAMLLVVDDVRQLGSAAAFDVAGPDCRILYTTHYATAIANTQVLDLTTTGTGVTGSTSDATLLVFSIDGSQPASAVVLDKDPIRIGRSADNDIPVADASVSRHHLLLTRVGGHWHVARLPEAVTLYVNGQLQDECDLRQGDQLVIGGTTLRLHLAAAPSSPVAALAPPQGHVDAVSAHPPIPHLQVECLGLCFFAPLFFPVMGIGRAPESAIIVPSSLISSLHAILRRQNADGTGAYEIEEGAGAHNHFQIGRKRLRGRRLLHHGDILTLGKPSDKGFVRITYLTIH